jgi:hypothetical protein
MRLIIAPFIAVFLACSVSSQTSDSCSCGLNYHEFYQDLIQYNGAAHETPDPDL